MPYNDWNKNGRSDSFDRYIDYKVSHSTNNTERQSSVGSSYDECFNSKKDVKNSNDSYQPKEEKPPFLVIVIISVIIGILSGLLAGSLNR